MSTLKANSWYSNDNIFYEKMINYATASIPGQGAYVVNPAGNYTATTLTVTITSKRANSAFWVEADTQGYIHTNASNGWNIALVRTISGVNTFIAGVNGSNDAWMGLWHGSGLGAISWSKARTCLDLPNVAKGTSITYTVYWGGWTGTSTGEFGYNGYGDMKNRITVFEIAQ